MNVHDVFDGFARAASSAGILFAPLNDAPWVARFERKLTAGLPAAFRSLISRDEFPAFEIGSLTLFAGRENDADEDELSMETGGRGKACSVVV